MTSYIKVLKVMKQSTSHAYDSSTNDIAGLGVDSAFCLERIGACWEGFHLGTIVS